ncbi:hypothetical protein [Candidatus Methylobacter oryzae]|uniref:Glycosyltransferase RgtA/B/C/D-like domain-containing protein n=1 Tax=Candidatus Methylobacter oryzae TaxID=2497749 RepID=A0ABY3C7W1_9GAMM|nr:hypothetical protein [Candidatus Methylobacter oryzae]TRW91474.1 hypothetical protein EKO24_016285 [Candidatus Methylobacter oryzae]
MKYITPIRILLSAMVLVSLWLAGSGGLTPSWTPDTDGYLHPWTWDSLWGQPRNPLLGFLLAPFNDNYTLLPAIELGAFFSAIYYLYRRLVEFGTSELAALALTLPLVISNLVLRYGHEIHPEFPAVILLIFAIAEMIGFHDSGKRSLSRYALFMLALGFSYILRPSLLPFIGLMPVLFLFLGFVQTRRWNVGTSMVILLLSAVPFLVVSSIRYQTVKDFNIVSFGGVTMSPIAGSIVSEELIPRFAADHRELARTILDKREAMAQAGELSPMVIDYETGKRSFRRTARSYFDILASNADEIQHKIVKQTRQENRETWVQFNQRIMSFCIDVVRNAPADYAMWIAGAARSATGTAITQNIPLIVGIFGLVAVYCLRLLSPRMPPLIAGSSLDIPTIVLITALFTFGSGILSLLVTYPGNRYVSTSAIFIPSLVFYILFQLLAAGYGDKVRRD